VTLPLTIWAIDEFKLRHFLILYHYHLDHFYHHVESRIDNHALIIRKSRRKEKVNKRDQMKQIFNQVYTTNRWGKSGKGSGPGSDPKFAQNAVKFLRDIIRRYSIKTITDVSCGGMAWWVPLLDEFPHIKFYGYDISSVIIDQNKRQFANRRNWTFGVKNAISDKFNPTDLMVCRHTMMHLALNDASTLLKNLSSSGSRFLVLTSHPSVQSNDDIHRIPLFPSAPQPPGTPKTSTTTMAYRFKPMNLELSPFKIKPIEFVVEPQSVHEILGLYKLN
jgi:hypothetical protein